MQSHFYREAETLLLLLSLTTTLCFIAASGPACHNSHTVSVAVRSRLSAQIRVEKSELDCLLSILRALMMGETAGEEPGADTLTHRSTQHQSHWFWISEAALCMLQNLKYLQTMYRKVTVHTYSKSPSRHSLNSQSQTFPIQLLWNLIEALSKYFKYFIPSIFLKKMK